MGRHVGTPTYTDLLDREWETRFKLLTGPDGRIRPIVCCYGLSANLPPPNYPLGWDMPEGSPRLALPSAGSSSQRVLHP